MKVKLLKKLRKDNKYEFIHDKIVLNNSELFERDSVILAIQYMCIKCGYTNLYLGWIDKKKNIQRDNKIKKFRQTGIYE